MRAEFEACGGSAALTAGAHVHVVWEIHGSPVRVVEAGLRLRRLIRWCGKRRGTGAGGSGFTRTGRIPPTHELLWPKLLHAPRQQPPPLVALLNCQTLQLWSLQQLTAHAAALFAF